MIKRIAVGVVALVVMAIAAFLVTNRTALFVEKRTLSQMRALIEPTFLVAYPANQQAGQTYPVAILVHGCGGRKDADLQRAKLMNDAGFITLSFASQAPRNLTVDQVCQGKALLGFERVVDLQLAVDYAKQIAGGNPNQIVVLGYSHGAFTLFEAMARQGNQIAALSTDKVVDLTGVAAAVAYYPYCGAAAFYRYLDAQYAIPTLVYTAGKDQITAPLPCGEFVAGRQAKGEPLSIMHFSQVSHGFDINEDWVKHYDASIAQQAFDQQLQFITKQLAH